MRYTVYYEKNHEQREVVLDSLNAIEDWVRSIMKYGFDKRRTNFCIPSTVLGMKVEGWMMEPLLPRDGGTGQYRVRMIQDENGGIVFSDGAFTSGEKHISKKLFTLTNRLQKEYIQANKAPKFNFVE